MTTSTSFGRATVIIIGAGHSGLAMSHCLSVRGVDHLILDRSRPGHSWSERWHSLRLLTPNWQTRNKINGFLC